MNNARLLAVSIERFKSFKQPTRIELAPLTIILGRNNSGKSTIIQSLLLLKQTLGDPRPDVRLKLEGVVEAFNLRELTFGWPAASDTFHGPDITLEWDSEVDVRAALKLARDPDLANLAKHSGVEWLGTPPERRVLTTSLTLHTTEVGGVAQISEITLRSLESTSPAELRATLSPEGWTCSWNGQAATKIAVELDHFIPYLRIDRRGSGLGPKDKQRAWRLPALSDDARYPFCPPDRWWKGSTTAWRTVASKPAWLDQHGNGWARPNIPGGAGYHWDVFIDSPSLQQAVGLGQINVVEFGAPASEGTVGHLHHVPSANTGMPTGTGWSC